MLKLGRHLRSQMNHAATQYRPFNRHLETTPDHPAVTFKGLHLPESPSALHEESDGFLTPGQPPVAGRAGVFHPGPTDVDQMNSLLLISRSIASNRNEALCFIDIQSFRRKAAGFAFFKCLRCQQLGFARLQNRPASGILDEILVP
jgi:hypothetical protein